MGRFRSQTPWTDDEVKIILAHPKLKRSKASACFLKPLLPDRSWQAIMAKMCVLYGGRITQRETALKARMAAIAAKAKAALAAPQRAPDQPMSVMQALFGDPSPERSALREWRERQNRPVSVSAVRERVGA